jgi:hypothetical protein
MTDVITKRLQNELANITTELREKLNGNMLDDLNDKVVSVSARVNTGISAANRLRKIVGQLIEKLPLIYTVLALISIFVVTGYILWHVFFKKTNPGIEGARKAYSIFHLITSCMIVITIIAVALPTSDRPSEAKKSKVAKFFETLNNLINIAFVPIMLAETIFIVLTVFIISFMFLIISSLLRTYYAIQCPLGQSIEFNWWGRIIDLVMFCLLGVSFVVILIAQISNFMYYFITFLLKTKSDVAIGMIRGLLSISRRLFVMTLSYYILYSLFLGIEYFISSNILAIHNWEKDDPTVVCTSEVSGAPKSADNKLTAEYVVKIFYLIFNIVLCIAIWILIGVLIYGHGNLAGMVPKIVKAIIIVMEVVLFFTAGNMSEDTIKTVIENMIGKFKSVIPENTIPKELRDPNKLMAMLKDKLTEALPETNVNSAEEDNTISKSINQKVTTPQETAPAETAPPPPNERTTVTSQMVWDDHSGDAIDERDLDSQHNNLIRSEFQQESRLPPPTPKLQIKVEKLKKKGLFKSK